nr:AMP-binding protein [Cellvibrionaceae bacterium]
MSLSMSVFSGVKKRLASLLSVEPDDINEKDNLFQLGIDSMQMMTLLNELKSENIHIRLRDLYQEPSLLGLRHLIKKAASDKKQSTENSDKDIDAQSIAPWPTMSAGKDFPLTPVQHAYYVGRSSEQVLGGVGCHLYQEFDGEGLDPHRLDSAIMQLIQRHPMLNVSFSADGKQAWQSDILWQGITLHDFSQQDFQQQQKNLLALRDTLSHRVLNVEAGQCFDVQLVQLAQRRHRLIVDIDLLVMDAASFSLFFTELSALIQGQHLPSVIEQYDFCSYLAQAEKEQVQDKIIAQQYWSKKIDTLPPAPALPLVIEPSKNVKPVFVRRRQVYSNVQWNQLKQLAAEHQLTPTMALATVFAVVLSRWSGQEKLLLNLTLFDCLPLHKHIDRMLADFTNVVLLDACLDQRSLIESMRALQSEFADVYEHRSLSGVEVLRQLRKQASHPYGAPVVFTSNLGRSLYGDNTEEALGQLGWGISQTPQVWIDFVAYEHCDQLYLQWDSNKALFPEGLLDAMFDAFNALVLTLSDNRQAWSDPIPSALPVTEQAVRKKINHHVTVPVSDNLLHELIMAQAQQSPDSDALIDGDQCLSYGVLIEKAQRLAATLIAKNMQAGERVAISMDKGAGQIIAALGILFAGGVYVPVPPNQPDARRQKIYSSASIRQVIVCDQSLQSYSWPEGVDYFSWQQAQSRQPLSNSLDEESKALSQLKVLGHQHRRSPDDEAYIIYTS